MSPCLHVSMPPCLHVSVSPCLHVSTVRTIFTTLRHVERIPKTQSRIARKFMLPTLCWETSKFTLGPLRWGMRKFRLRQKFAPMAQKHEPTEGFFLIIKILFICIGLVLSGSACEKSYVFELTYSPMFILTSSVSNLSPLDMHRCLVPLSYDASQMLS
jgi:hypothetical protein